MDPYVAEIRLFPFNFPPKGWAQCLGQTLPISQNTALYSLLGTNFGGDGRSTFGLPNLQGATAIAVGQGPGMATYVVGESGGEPAVTLTSNTMATHIHSLNAVDVDGVATQSLGAMLSKSATGGRGGGGVTAEVYGPAPASTPTAPTALGLTGGVAAHNNMQPYLALNYCIALQGVFPQRP